MAYVIKMPKIGMEMQEGVIVRWFVDPGERIEEGEPVVEIESEKSASEIDAQEDGLLRRIFCEPGERAEPGEPLGIVAEAGEPIEGMVADLDVSDDGSATTAGPSDSADERAVPESTPPARVTPRARRRAVELDFDLGTLSAADVEGPVTEADVEAAAKGAAEEPEDATASTREAAEKRATRPVGDSDLGEAGPATDATDRTVLEERPLAGTRETIAERLGESYRNAVHVTEHRKVDAEALLDAVAELETEADVDASITDLVLLALSEALEEHPAFNATFEDGVHRLFEEQHVGIAVDVEDGLITPVVRDAGEMTLPELATERRRLTDRALGGDYSPADLRGGTFTVTNLGPFDVESFDPIIDPPQVAILGVNAIVERAASVDGEVELRRKLPLDLSFDHRVVDGADAARFLSTLASHLEEPWPLLPDSVRPPGETAEGTVQPGREVSARTEGGLAGTVAAGSVEWPFDEPTDAGGAGTAPTPVDMFLGALSACLSASVGFQANKRGVDLAAVETDVDAEPEHGSVESVDVTVRLEADADVDDETLDRIVTMGERGCRVAELLRDDLPIAVTWRRT